MELDGTKPPPCYSAETGVVLDKARHKTKTGGSVGSGIVLFSLSAHNIVHVMVILKLKHLTALTESHLQADYMCNF